MNGLKPETNIRKCLWVSVAISTLFYLVLGILGAMAYQMDADSDILSILSANGILFFFFCLFGVQRLIFFSYYYRNDGIYCNRLFIPSMCTHHLYTCVHYRYS